MKILFYLIMLFVVISAQNAFCATYDNYTLIEERFDNEFIPSGWEVINNLPDLVGSVWDIKYNYYQNGLNQTKDYYANINTYDDPSRDIADTTINTYSIDAAEYKDVRIRFCYDHISSGNAAKLSFSIRDTENEVIENYLLNASDDSEKTFDLLMPNNLINSSIVLSWHFTCDIPNVGSASLYWVNVTGKKISTEDLQEKEDSKKNNYCGGCNASKEIDNGFPLTFGIFVVGFVVFLISRKK